MAAPNTTPLTYNGYVTQIGVMAVVDTELVTGVVQGTDAYFNSTIPQMLNYAELRIQRDLDLLPLQTSGGYTLTEGNNQLSISVNDFVTIQTFSVEVAGSLVPLLSVSKEWIQNVYPGNSTPAPPQFFAMIGGDAATGGNTSSLIMLGPPPDDNYPVSVFGSIRMPTLYQFATAGAADNSTTFISTYLPDLLIMASLIYISAYQRNFGRISDDPAMAMTYETQYQLLLKGGLSEEYRKRFEATAWSSMSNSPVASPSR